MQRVIRITRDARDARYSLLRGYFHGADDDGVEEREQARLQSVTLPAAARCLGETLQDQAFNASGISVVSVRRVTGGVVAAKPEHVLSAGDTLVLSGLPQALALAEERLLRG
jgi:CPA2 family monovalent cation:H+ antiporter-2